MGTTSACVTPLLFLAVLLSYPKFAKSTIRHRPKENATKHDADDKPPLDCHSPARLPSRDERLRPIQLGHFWHKRGLLELQQHLQPLAHDRSEARHQQEQSRPEDRERREETQLCCPRIGGVTREELLPHLVASFQPRVCLQTDLHSDPLPTSCPNHLQLQCVLPF